MNGKIKRFIKRYGADILSVAAGIGVAITGITAYQAGKHESDKDNSDKHNIRTIAVPMACGTATVAAIAGSRYLGAKREAELAAAGVLVATNFAAYRNSVISTADRETVDKIDENYITNNLNSIIEVTGQGDIVFIEEWTGRRFLSSLEAVQEAIAKFETDFQIMGYACTNNLYKYLGIATTLDGEIIGWSDKEVTGYQFDENDNVIFDEALLRVGIYLEEYPSLGYVIRYPVSPIVNFLGGCISPS